MKQIQLYISALISVLLLAGCQRSGYYEEGEQKIIDDLTQKNWTRNYKFDFDGKTYEGQETYTFKKDGSVTLKVKEVDSDGKVHETTRTHQWAFYTPDFSVLYFNFGTYWQLRDLTPPKLSVTEIVGEYNGLTSLRTNKEFTVSK